MSVSISCNCRFQSLLAMGNSASGNFGERFLPLRFTGILFQPESAALAHFSPEIVISFQLPHLLS